MCRASICLRRIVRTVDAVPTQETVTFSQLFSANGKLMLTGEYLVLDGAQSLAVPTLLGQHLEVALTDVPDVLTWESLEADGNCWLQAEFSRKALRQNIPAVQREPRARLGRLLHHIFEQHPLLWPAGSGLHLRTRIDFDRSWGLGSSATLSYLLAAFAGIDPYDLNYSEFGGSGYDIACAGSDGPISYQLVQGRPQVAHLATNLPGLEGCYFVHLAKKQDSREAIKNYRAQAGADLYRYTSELDELTTALIHTSDREEAAGLLRQHEALVGYVTHQLPVGRGLFADFKGTVKSLGAWGGDFILAVPTTQIDVPGYFASHGLTTCIPARELLRLPPKPVPVQAPDPACWPTFLYGALAEPRQDNEWLHGHAYHPADLHGYKLAAQQSDQGAESASSKGLLQSDDTLLPGMLVYLTPEEIIAMDIHPEGAGLRRTQVQVQVGGVVTRAFAWV